MLELKEMKNAQTTVDAAIPNLQKELKTI